MELNGIICMYKPKGFTSFDVIAKLRGILKMKRLGHSGTLDPMAEGVLPVFAGRAAMASDMLPDSDKIYRAGFKLGITSDTQDITGNITASAEADISEEKLREALDAFRGDILQIPPMYSAVSVNGQRLYDLARKNIVVEREPRPITVYRLELLSYDRERAEGQLEIACSKGTYIRTLIDDIGDSLGVGGVMTSLVRTRACGFELSDCTSFEELQKEADSGGDFSKWLLPIEKVFEYLPELRLSASEEYLYRNGIKLDTKRVDFHKKADKVRVYGTEGFIGTADIDADGTIRVGKTFELPVNKPYNGGFAAALGLFDGVHRGHRAVISEAVRLAGEMGLRSEVFTFRTETVSSKLKSSSCIITNEEKKRRIKSCGADFVFSADFADMRDMSAERFVKKVLMGRLKAEAVVCGEDFRFGKNAECGASELRELCEKYGIGFVCVKDIPDENGSKISSGRLRELISEGAVDKAAALMGEPVVVEGRVIEGNRLGRTIGIPTINQRWGESLVKVRFGVYAARVEYGGRVYEGIANVGVKPTVESSGEVLCETNIFDFDEDIYGRNVRVYLLSFVREERKFGSVDELKNQINSDIQYIKGMIKNGDK